MALVTKWTAKVVVDRDKSDVGSASAIYQEWDDSDPETITYLYQYPGGRVKLTAQEAVSVVAEARAALVIHRAQEANDLAKTNYLQAEFDKEI